MKVEVERRKTKRVTRENAETSSKNHQKKKKQKTKKPRTKKWLKI